MAGGGGGGGGITGLINRSTHRDLLSYVYTSSHLFNTVSLPVPKISLHIGLSSEESG